jgi:hypothetical protein
LKARFPQFLGVDADTAIALTALAAYWWVAQAPQLPTTPDAALIDQRTWLGDIALAPEALATYLDTLSFRPEDLPGLFDAFPIKGLDVRQVLPFRRRPFLRVDPDRVAIVCPQLVTEKGGIDLLWRLTHDPGGPKEVALWTADFGVLCEGYVQHVLTSSGSAVGGTWVSDIAWTIDKKAGQIDLLLHDANTLVLCEIKGSFLGAGPKVLGTADAVRADLERKFVQGDQVTGKAKGVRQLVHAIQWLARQRKEGRTVAGIDLRNIETIIPMLAVADRSLRFPRLGRWFDARLREILGTQAMPWRIGALTICGLEDLDHLEQIALAGGATIIQSLKQYDLRFPNAEEPLWRTYDKVRGPHPRLNRTLEIWFESLKARGALRP